MKKYKRVQRNDRICLKVMIVESMNLVKADNVRILKKEIVRRGEHKDDLEQD